MKWCILFLFCIPLFSEPLQVKISSPRAILINAKTGAVLYEKNADEQCFPASTTKIATALYALEKKGHALDESVVATKDDLQLVLPSVKQALDSVHPPYRLETDGTLVHIKVGEKLTLRTLIYGVMVASGNDVSNVLARAVSGSIPQFMEEVNAYLRSHGIMETHFTNPHGLHHHQHVTTARDLAKLAQLAMRNKQFHEMMRTVEVSCGKKTLKQTNKLLRKGRFYYSKAIGMKTGNTRKAGYTFVAAAEDDERTLIAVVLGAQTSDERFKDAIVLFDKAFAEKKIHRTLFDKESDFFTKKVEGGKSVLCASLGKSIAIDFFPSEEKDIQVKVLWNEIEFPIEKGENVGSVLILDDEERLLQQESFFTQERVEETFVHMCTSHVLFRPALIVISFGFFTFVLYRNLKKRTKRRNRSKKDPRAYW